MGQAVSRIEKVAQNEREKATKIEPPFQKKK